MWVEGDREFLFRLRAVHRNDLMTLKANSVGRKFEKIDLHRTIWASIILFVELSNDKLEVKA